MNGTSLALGRMLGLALAVALPASADDTPPAARRILAVHAFEPGLPADFEFTAGLREALPLGREVALYSEYLDRLRFPASDYEDRFRTWLRAKYALAPPDLVLAVGPDALRFLADPRTNPFPGVPVVFGMVPEGTVPGWRLPPGVTGVTILFATRETVDLALALFPDTERVVLVGGASRQDEPLNDLLRRGVAAAGRPREVVELFGLSMAEIQARLRALPPRSIVLVTSFFRDGAGRQWVGTQTVPALYEASPAPLFVPHAHLFGLGPVGGVLTDFHQNGANVGRMALRVLAGEAPPVERAVPGRPRVDGRQLTRWDVPDERVPAGAEVLFREASAWTRYRPAIVLVACALGLQAGLIALLLVERRRRWRAEASARQNLMAVARMNRASALGQLVASLAHEVNSPLTAVLCNAETAQRLLQSPARDEAEVRACLDDIVRDVTRAGDVITRIRGMLRGKRGAPVEVDVAAAIRDALHLVEAELRDRGVEVVADVAPGLPPVTGDPVQLVQVVLNLVVNALEAVRDLPESRRRIRVRAAREGDGVVIRVQDSGPGVPAEVADRVFEPFFTTKPHGIGMGLAVIRSIVEGHGGTVELVPEPGGGATFEVRLPVAEEAAGASSLPARA